MAISFVGHAGAEAAVVTLPAFVAGDLAVVFAFRNGSGTAASLATGWTNIASDVNVNVSYRVGYKILTASDVDTGTWTNAVDTQVDVYRGASGIGALGTSTKGNSTVLSTPAVTLQVTTGSAWVLGQYGHDIATTAHDRTQTGMTTRSAGHAPTNLFAADAANVTSWAAPPTTTVNGSGRWIGFALELLVAPLYLSQDFTIEFYIGGNATGIPPIGIVAGKVLQGSWLPEAPPPPTTWTPPAAPGAPNWGAETPSSGTWVDGVPPIDSIPFIVRYPVPIVTSWPEDMSSVASAWILPSVVSLTGILGVYPWIPYLTVEDLSGGVDFVPKASAVAPYHASTNRPIIVHNISTLTAASNPAERRP